MNALAKMMNAITIIVNVNAKMISVIVKAMNKTVK